MKKLFKYIELFIEDTFDSLNNFSVTVLAFFYKKKDIVLPLVIGCLFLSFLKELVYFFNAADFKNIKHASKISALNPNWFLLFVVFIFSLVVGEVLIRIQKKSKIKGDIIPLSDRIFALVPYILFLIEITNIMSSSCVTFLNLSFSPEVSFFIGYKIINPIIDAMASLPGFKAGLLNQFFFYFNFYYIGRNRSKFSYFVRYFFVQSLSVTTVFIFTINLYGLIIKYGLDPFYKEALGVYIYAVYLLLTVIFMIYALLGKEPKFPALHPSILYHVGLKEKKKKKKKKSFPKIDKK